MARPLFGRHPWLFAAAIDRIDGLYEPGDSVRVLSNEGQFVAHGLINPHSKIRVRLYSWEPDQPVTSDLINHRIEQAVRLRNEALGLGDPAGACRLVYSESDGLSGLVVDRYADTLVVQFTSLAMARHEAAIVDCLRSLLSPRGIYRRTERGMGSLEHLDLDDRLLWGEVGDQPISIVENGLTLRVDVREGQKTGAFLDQRDNRLALCRYVSGRSVLDLFCHSGAFGLLAVKRGGASSLTAIDVSASAIALARENARLADVDADFRQQEVTPALTQLRREGRRFGVIICDPPKFARSTAAIERALHAYEQLHLAAIELLEPGGILLACSCSGLVSPAQFVQTVAQASQRARRHLLLLEQRGQAPDHPISVYCLETGYLKCLIARCTDAN